MKSNNTQKKGNYSKSKSSNNNNTKKSNENILSSSSSQLNFKNELHYEKQINNINNFDQSLSPIKKFNEKGNVFKIQSLNFNKLNKSTNINVNDNNSNNISKEKFTQYLANKSIIKKFISYNPKIKNQNSSKSKSNKKADSFKNSNDNYNPTYKKINNTFCNNKSIQKKKIQNKIDFSNFIFYK